MLFYSNKILKSLFLCTHICGPLHSTYLKLKQTYSQHHRILVH